MWYRSLASATHASVCRKHKRVAYGSAFCVLHKLSSQMILEIVYMDWCWIIIDFGVFRLRSKFAAHCVREALKSFRSILKSSQWAKNEV